MFTNNEILIIPRVGPPVVCSKLTSGYFEQLYRKDEREINNYAKNKDYLNGGLYNTRVFPNRYTEQSFFYSAEVRFILFSIN